MGDGSLSQDEIDALLQGADDIISPSAPAPSFTGGAGAGFLSPPEQNALRDVLNSVAGIVAPTLAGYLGGKNLTITNAFVETKSAEALRYDFVGQFVQVSMGYTGAVSGNNLVVFNMSDAGTISSLMMGSETGAPPAEMTDAHLSTIQEFINQLLSSMATQMSSRIGGGIGTTPAAISIVKDPSELRLSPGDAVKITYDISIEGILNSRFFHVMDASVASGLTRGSAPAQSFGGGQQARYQQQEQVGISPVKFPPLDEGITTGVVGDISLLLDVPMTLTVELGRTTRLVQEILGLGEGSIIELDKLAGEPVDLLVNGKLIAKGEVVVIDENFGVRVTDIVSPDERLINFRSNA